MNVVHLMGWPAKDPQRNAKGARVRLSVPADTGPDGRALQIDVYAFGPLADQLVTACAAAGPVRITGSLDSNERIDNTTTPPTRRWYHSVIASEIAAIAQTAPELIAAAPDTEAEVEEPVEEAAEAPAPKRAKEKVVRVGETAPEVDEPTGDHRRGSFLGPIGDRQEGDHGIRSHPAPAGRCCPARRACRPPPNRVNP